MFYVVQEPNNAKSACFWRKHRIGGSKTEPTKKVNIRVTVTQ